MTQLADYDVTVVLARGDERRSLVVRLPAAGEDLAVAAGYEIADTIREASAHEWARADVAHPVTAVLAAFLNVLPAGARPPSSGSPGLLPGPDEG